MGNESLIQDLKMARTAIEFERIKPRLIKALGGDPEQKTERLSEVIERKDEKTLEKVEKHIKEKKKG